MCLISCAIYVFPQVQASVQLLHVQLYKCRVRYDSWTIPEGLTAPGEDDDSPGFSCLLNESMFEIFAQPGMSDLLNSEKHGQKSREEGRAAEVDSTQGTIVNV